MYCVKLSVLGPGRPGPRELQRVGRAELTGVRLRRPAERVRRYFADEINRARC